MFRTGRGFADGDRLQVDGATVRLSVNPRARRVSLRLDRRGGEVIAVAPSQRLLPAAVAFARERGDWIVERLAEFPKTTPLVPGAMLSVFGEPVRLEQSQGRARWLPASADAPARIAAMGEGEGYTRAVVRQLKRRALDVLSDRTAVHCAALARPTPDIAVMDARSRWGSCTPGPTPKIRYSWRLALAPFVVADYVAAHECAHLLEANHGPRFWGHVQSLVGDHRPHRAWLRAQGAWLHGVGG
ncbi:M48 family metallopeptidase [Phenylobacterium sp.]|uniref:M48 family metallopeptidase n=1 Tax=Phenylobacterium sp. TaxID=1871053 RepID=UPI002732B6F1|nr:SprT family zinc-dependent metalloprotease [Phenylobacterium sp.]MDP3660252.1 SprT family zinc-dependent metalloprotease [Phenylobacterium sp.]